MKFVDMFKELLYSEREFETLGSKQVILARTKFTKELFSVIPDNLREAYLRQSSSNILSNFATKAIKSYDEDRFKDKIPEIMRPLLDREYALSVPPMHYHGLRTEYIKEINGILNRDPYKLINLESFLLSFLYRHIIYDFNQTNEEASDAYLKFLQMEANLSDLYCLLSTSKFGKERYLLGIEKSGQLHSKPLKRLDKASPDKRINSGQRLAEVIKDWVMPFNAIHSHAVTFLNMDPRILKKIVPDNVFWASEENRLRFKPDKMNGAIGPDMLRAGIVSKHFHSSLPYEVLVQSENISKMRVIDVPPYDIYFTTEYGDGTISAGMLGIPNPNHGGNQLFHLSDLASRLILDDIASTKETNCLFDIAGCIARDMFVLEERDNFYQEIKDGGKKKSKKKPAQDKKIIWLPRFRVNVFGAPDNTNDAIPDKIISLSPSHVSGHPRRCDNPNPDQISLAESVGIYLPPGFTYVREHDRAGSRPFTREYKSRSALELLFSKK